jgi:hypothetical protein
MNTDIDPRTGNWLLVMGPRKIVPTLLKMTARLAEEGPVRVVDCGNVYDVYQVGCAVHHDTMEVLDRVKVSQAYTCHQVLTILESLSSETVPFVVLDLLRTFNDEFVWIEERKRLLRKCLTHLDRLEKAAGGLVSVHPPRVLSQTESDLLEMIQEAGRDTYQVQMAAPASAPMRIF